MNLTKKDSVESVKYDKLNFLYLYRYLQFLVVFCMDPDFFGWVVYPDIELPVHVSCLNLSFKFLHRLYRQ